MSSRRDRQVVQVGDLKDLNAQSVLMDLRASGPSTGPELAERLGMTKPTVAASLRRLVSTELVRSLGTRPGQAGRSPELWAVDPQAGVVLGVDVGTQVVQVTVAGLDGAAVGRARRATAAGSGAALAATIQSTARDALGAAGRGLDDVVHAVVGVPGAVDPVTFSVRLAPNLPALGDPALLRRLRDGLGGRVELMKDVFLAARGELAVRPDDTDFVLLTVGHGLGAAIVRDGHAVSGAGGYAGEIGYLPLGPDRPVEGVAPLERAASVDALLAAAGDRGVPAATLDGLVEAAAAGSAAAAELLASEADLVAYALTAVLLAADPALVVLTGSVPLAGGSDFCAAVRERLDARLPFPAPAVELARTGPEATTAGAVAVALDRAWEVLSGRLARHGREPRAVGAAG